MKLYTRAVRGAEAGAVAAATVELSFFLLDLFRLEPLATPGRLSGAALGPGGVALDLTDASGVIAALWASYQILLLTIAHFLTFALVGVVASLAFDWTRSIGIGRYVALAGLCTVALAVTVAWSSSLVSIEAVGLGLVVGVNVLAAVVMAGTLRLVSLPEPEERGGAAQ